MKKSIFYGFSLIPLIAFITPSCKKDSLQDLQVLKKSALVQEDTKVNGTEQDQTKVNNISSGFDTGAKKPEPEPWLKSTEPEPEPWLKSAEPEPEPW